MRWSQMPRESKSPQPIFASVDRTFLRFKLRLNEGAYLTSLLHHAHLDVNYGPQRLL